MKKRKLPVAKINNQYTFYKAAIIMFKATIITGAVYLVVLLGSIISSGCETKEMTKTKAEAMASILMREPVECFGSTENNDGWQCLNGAKNRLVTCMEDACWLVK